MSNQLNILTPCHDKPLRMHVSFDGEDVEIFCNEPDCLNSWDEDGTPL